MDKLKTYFAKDRFARRNDIEVVEVSQGRAKARLSIGEHHLNALGIVQGGAIFTVADVAFAAASNSHGTVAVGVNVSITYMKSARSGTLLAEAKEVSKNQKLGTYAVEVRDDAGDLVAVFQGLVYRKAEPLE